MAENKIYKPRLLPTFLPYSAVLIYLIFEFVSSGIFSILMHDSKALVNALLGDSLYLIIMIPVIIIGILSWKFRFYELKEDGILIAKGIFAKSRGIILYSQIQEIHEYQSLMGRLLGYKNIECSTMSKTASGTLAYLSENDAREIKEILQTKLQQTSMNSGTMPYPIQPFKGWPIRFSPIMIILIAITVLINIVRLDQSFGILLLVIEAVILLIFGLYLISLLIIKKSTKYSLESDHIEKRVQFMSKMSGKTLYSKLQDIIISQTILQRICGTSMLKYETGEFTILDHNEKQNIKINNKIPFLSSEDALSLQSDILIKSGIKNTITKDLRSLYPIQKIKIFEKTISTTIKAGVLITLLCIIAQLFINVDSPQYDSRVLPSLTGIAVLMLFLVFISKLAYEAQYYKNYQYSDNDEILTLKKGVFSQSALTIPYRKVENIYVDRSLFDRVFNMWDVRISTAGSTGMIIHIHGLNTQNATNIRNLFIRRTIYRNISTQGSDQVHSAGN
jgi:membrane protein YdbS with pleckstrin-like domain